MSSVAADLATSGEGPHGSAPIDAEVLERAAAAPVEPIRTLDALHLASALLWESSIGSTTIASCNDRVRDFAAAPSDVRLVSGHTALCRTEGGSSQGARRATTNVVCPPRTAWVAGPIVAGSRILIKF